MHIDQARKMRDGLLKGDTVMARAWKELLPGYGGSSDSDVSPDSPSPGSSENPDTTEERKALGIPPIHGSEEDSEGW